MVIDDILGAQDLFDVGALDLIGGTSGNDVLVGTTGDDTFDLHDGGIDRASGGDGDDVFLFGASFTGNDQIDGGKGHNTVVLDGDYAAATQILDHTFKNVDEIRVAAGHDYYLYDAAYYGRGKLVVDGAELGAGDSLRFDATGRPDIVEMLGGAGDDSLFGGRGDDTLVGSDGDDAISGGDDGSDLVYGGAGDDYLNTGAWAHNSDTLKGGEGNDHLIGQGSFDFLLGGAGDDFIEINQGGQSTVTGGGGDDVIIAQSQFEGVDDGGGVTGAQGDDLITIVAGTGGWRVEGGVGHDVFRLQSSPGHTLAGASSFDGQSGHDTFDGSMWTKALTIDLATGLVTGKTIAGDITLTSIESVIGTGRADQLTGDAGANTLDGALGTDRLDGGDGDDRLLGGYGADTLTGGLGSDLLVGGHGSDTYVFAAVADSSASAADVIAKLQHGDVVNLAAIDADTATGGDQAFHIVAAFTHQAGELTVSYDAGLNRTTIVGDVDGDGTADVIILAAGDHHDFTNFVL